MLHSYFERKNDKVLLVPLSNKLRTSQFQNLVSAGGAY